MGKGGGDICPFFLPTRTSVNPWPPLHTAGSPAPIIGRGAHATLRRYVRNTSTDGGTIAFLLHSHLDRVRMSCSACGDS